MKKITLILVLFFTFCASFFTAEATNVSGGIYSNTTWTFSNSPYIVTDNVVVFPGVTLTIEAGVTVKFADGKGLEIRQSTLIAVGSALDSITFTSNSGSPVSGIWTGINLNSATGNKINYCNVFFANLGIGFQVIDTLHLKNSNLSYNVKGLQINNTIIDSCSFRYNTWGGIFGAVDSMNFCNISNNQVGGVNMECWYMSNCIIDSNQTGLEIGFTKFYNCSFKYNQTGVLSAGDNAFKHCIMDSNYVTGISLGNYIDSLINCEVKYNHGIGVSSNGPGVITKCDIEYNNLGVQLNYQPYIQCNKICNNITYDLKYGSTLNSNIIIHNYWGTTDSAIIASHIWDGYDSVALGLLTFMPIDTQNCYLTGCNLQLTTISINATCGTCANGSASVSVANGFAPFTYTWNTSPIQTTAHATGLLPGVYTVCVVDANGCTACHSVTIDSINCSTFHISLMATNATCSTCNDGSGIVTATGGTSPYTYSWYTSPMQYTSTAHNLSAGTYTVCVLDAGGCVLCDTVHIATGYCSAHFNLSPDTIPHHYLATNLASGVPPLTYDWNWGDNSTHDFTPYPSHTYAAAGYYSICLTIHDSVGCGDMYCNSFYLLRTENAMVYVNVIGNNFTTTVKDNNAAPYCSLFPNPNDGNFTIQAGIANYELRIMDVYGRKVYSQQITNSQGKESITLPLSNGIYLWEVQTPEGILSNGKLCVMRN